MKIKTKEASYDLIETLKKPEHKNPKKPGFLFRTLVRLLAKPDLKATNFTFDSDYKERAGEGPYLILMNHSSFIDLEIVSRIFYPMPYSIVCTSDGFVGKEWLMRNLGCIPTQKFVCDITLINDIIYSLKHNSVSVLMYPEASYSFDGTATRLPEGLGRLLKKLDVPVVMVKTEGAFAFDPLYNCLKKRKVNVKAHVSCLFSLDEIRNNSMQELEEKLFRTFDFDNFAWQYDNKIKISESFRADGLNRILYKCTECGEEGCMDGKGTEIKCCSCGAEYEMDEYGRLHAKNGKTRFEHIPDWFRWQRECVKKELENGTYKLESDVDIGIMEDYKAIYKVGRGKLVHDKNGFSLSGCDGKLEYHQKPLMSYGLYSDYYWYEIGDVICIGNKERLYYCFPDKKDIVAKARIAAEELYKISKPKRLPRKKEE